MGESIFINYRRGEDQAAAGRLYDQLEAAFTRERIFIDVDNIAPGRDFTEELATRVEQCDVFLAVVGRRWADVVDVDGSRRLDNPNDWVRVEIESAQRLGKHIIPVLVDGAEMPRPEKLPDALLPFARRNAARLTHERFRADVQALVVAIGRLREAERARREAERSQAPRAAETLAVSAHPAGEAAPPAQPPSPEQGVPTPAMGPRLRQTLGLLLQGEGEKQIAAKLKLSPHTVHGYVKEVYRRFDVCSRAELLALWVKR